MYYAVSVKVERQIRFDDLDDEDREVGRLYAYAIEAKSREEAEEKALDIFHSTVPINVLEDFGIIATASETTEGAFEGLVDGLQEGSGERPEREYRVAAVYTIRFTNFFEVYADSTEEAKAEGKRLEGNVAWQDFWGKMQKTGTQVFVVGTPTDQEAMNVTTHE